MSALRLPKIPCQIPASRLDPREQSGKRGDWQRSALPLFPPLLMQGVLRCNPPPPNLPTSPPVEIVESKESDGKSPCRNGEAIGMQRRPARKNDISSASHSSQDSALFIVLLERVTEFPNTESRTKGERRFSTRKVKLLWPLCAALCLRLG